MVRMRDVAEQAGVSVTTVSHVLNRSRPVNEDVRDRVLATMDSLGYRPNALARSLRRKETLTIGVIIPDSSNPFFAEVTRGIEEFSFEAGYNVILCNSAGQAARERRYTQTLIEKWVDGIAVAPVEDELDHIRAALHRGIPTVVLDREPRDVACGVVLVNNRAGGRQAVDHLLARGHRRIACIVAHAAARPGSTGRVDGYRDGMRVAGLEPEELLVYVDDLQQGGELTEMQAGYAAMREVLARSSPPPAVFLTNDLMAIGAMRAIAEQGLDIPRDVAVVGFDDIALASYTSPPLTTVAQPRLEMGRLVAEMLVGRSRESRLQPERHVLEARLVVRESS